MKRFSFRDVSCVFSLVYIFFSTIYDFYIKSHWSFINNWLYDKDLKSLSSPLSSTSIIVWPIRERFGTSIFHRPCNMEILWDSCVVHLGVVFKRQMMKGCLVHLSLSILTRASMHVW